MFERRKFLRHPIKAPIKLRPANQTGAFKSHTADLSGGGLMFLCSEAVEPGTQFDITLPVGNQGFKLKGRVAYCIKSQETDSFKIGIAFQGAGMAFRIKLAEEILRIQEFRYQVSRLLGKVISEEEAAAKWIEKYAERFADLYQA